MPDLFRRAIDAIMKAPSQVTAVGVAPARPASYGWLRRPDHDDERGEAWELPDGEIRIVARPEGGTPTSAAPRTRAARSLRR